MDEHTPTPSQVTIEPAGLLRNKYRVVVWGANHEKLLYSQPYVEKRQAQGLHSVLTMGLLKDGS